VCYALGRMDEAEFYFDGYLSLDPTDHGVRMAYARLWRPPGGTSKPGALPRSPPKRRDRRAYPRALGKSQREQTHSQGPPKTIGETDAPGIPARNPLSVDHGSNQGPLPWHEAGSRQADFGERNREIAPLQNAFKAFAEPGGSTLPPLSTRESGDPCGQGLDLASNCSFRLSTSARIMSS